MAEIHRHPALNSLLRLDERHSHLLHQASHYVGELMLSSASLAAELLRLQIELLNQARADRSIAVEVVEQHFATLSEAHEIIKRKVAGLPGAAAVTRALDDDISELRARLAQEDGGSMPK